jgi:hypothetical protein
MSSTDKAVLVSTVASILQAGWTVRTQAVDVDNVIRVSISKESAEHSGEGTTWHDALVEAIDAALGSFGASKD